MIEVGRLKLRPPRGDNTGMNQIPQTSISTCIEECIAENGKVFLIHDHYQEYDHDHDLQS